MVPNGGRRSLLLSLIPVLNHMTGCGRGDLVADSISVDTHEVRTLAAEVGKVAASALPEIGKIMKHGANNIKSEMVTDAQGSRWFKFAKAISYDEIGPLAYEIGPDRARGGKAGQAAHLANIAYFGGANGGGGTLDLDAPLAHEEPRMMKALDTYLAGLL